jgi:hypothetical protein
MFKPPLTKEERDELLARAARDLVARREALLAKDREMAKALKTASQSTLAEYLDRLPVVAMTACPFTGQVLRRSFDLFGFDGDWWRSGQPRYTATPLPRHFCVLRGAVHFGDPGSEETRKPRLPKDFEAETGPEVPYVIPRLLGKEGVIAVIGELDMAAGQKVHTIGYFGKPRPPVEELTADWPNQIHEWTTGLGEKGWNFPVDPWDFDLAPWIEKGKLRWCEPGSKNEKVAASTAPADCPYLDLPGRREQLRIGKYGLLGYGLPDGEPIVPLE